MCRDNAARPCSLMQNVTLVVSERDLDYITLMFSMFGSPLPGVKRLTDFFSQDLNFTHLDVSGPGRQRQRQPQAARGSRAGAGCAG